MLNVTKKAYFFAWAMYTVVFLALRVSRLTDGATPFFLFAILIPVVTQFVEKETGQKKGRTLLISRLLSICGFSFGVLTLFFFESERFLLSREALVFGSVLLSEITFILSHGASFFVCMTCFSESEKKYSPDYDIER